MNAEGWYRDPYGRHEDRWFSDGQPTKLVRDDGTESSDEPPSEPPSQPLVECEPTNVEAHGDDLKRADDVALGNEPDGEGVRLAVEEATARTYFPR